MVPPTILRKRERNGNQRYGLKVNVGGTNFTKHAGPNTNLDGANQRFLTGHRRTRMINQTVEYLSSTMVDVGGSIVGAGGPGACCPQGGGGPDDRGKRGAKAPLSTGLGLPPQNLKSAGTLLPVEPLHDGGNLMLEEVYSTTRLDCMMDTGTPLRNHINGRDQMVLDVVGSMVVDHNGGRNQTVEDEDPTEMVCITVAPPDE